MPVGALASHHDPVQSGSSLRAAARAMAEEGLHAILVAEGQRLVGVLDESALLQALAMGLDPNSPVEEVMDRHPVMIQPHMTGAEALRVFNDTGRHAIAVVDVMGNAVGVLTPSRLFHPRRLPYRPQIVGGLATPFGVYLTNGVVSGGARGLALASAGAALFLTFLVALYVVVGVVNVFHIDASGVRTQGWLEFASTMLFLVGLRAIPLSGTHGAEHMVVHAIERGEELVPEVVRRMPRVHPRCGTNIAVGALMFISLYSWEWTGEEGLRLLVAMLVTLFFWKPVGSFVQWAFTTKPPTDAQLMSGIRAGRELLDASARSRRFAGGVFQRLFASGIFHVIAGATMAQLAVYLIESVLNVPEAWRVISTAV